MPSEVSIKTIQSIRPDQRTALPGPPNAPFVREEYVGDGHVWIGEVTTEPGSASPWHHHGDHQTYAYVLEGEATIEFAGESGVEKRRVEADGSLHVVPGGLSHRELNTGTSKNRFLIIRVGDGPTVVPLDGPEGTKS